MVEEQQIQVTVSRRMLNLLTSMMPTTEGLLLVTVLNGREGLLMIRFHQSMAGDIAAFLNTMANNYPDEFKPETIPDRLS